MHLRIQRVLESKNVTSKTPPEIQFCILGALFRKFKAIFLGEK